ncbi:MAG: type II toxin-antitoxin system RelE/ParE family toxin [Pseudomonadota bacterium]|jgi:mRNA interferase RelE/StbE|uniref:type II toxin-antitoxin system RelE family toxin n=1 Tax=Roseixanthobacter finlandensis TaxID=3119922 RepID=UPI0037296198
MKTVTYTPTAARALRKHANRAVQIRAKIEQYASDPASLAANVKHLQGVHALRLRVGDFRVILQETASEVTVLDIGPRGGIYE